MILSPLALNVRNDSASLKGYSVEHSSMHRIFQTFVDHLSESTNKVERMPLFIADPT
jgi:hypothetical protein